MKIELEKEIRENHIISMVLQPIIENSIEHGFRGIGKVLHISLTGYREKRGDIHLIITDDGKGMSRERMDEINGRISAGNIDQTQISAEEDSRSIGLRNIAERIKIQYGAVYYIRILSSTENGTKIEICIPAQ